MNSRISLLIFLTIASSWVTASAREPINTAIKAVASKTVAKSAVAPKGQQFSLSGVKGTKADIRDAIQVDGDLFLSGAEDDVSYEIRLGTGPVQMPQIVDNFLTGQRFFSIDVQIRKSPGTEDFLLTHSADIALSYEPNKVDYLGHDIPNPEVDFGGGFTVPLWDPASDANEGLAVMVLFRNQGLWGTGLSTITVNDNWHTLGRFWFRQLAPGDTTFAFDTTFDTLLYPDDFSDSILPAVVGPPVVAEGGILPASFEFEHTTPSAEGYYGASLSLHPTHTYSAGSLATAFVFLNDGTSYADFNTFGVPLLPPPFDSASIGVDVWSSTGSPWTLLGISGDNKSFYGLTSSNNPGADLPITSAQSSQFMILLAP